jgi:hypothetical protein
VVGDQKVFAGESSGLKNSSFHTRDVKQRCETKLSIQFKDGSEFNGWFKEGKSKIARITVAKGRKPIPPKTYKTMAQQLKLTTEQFDDFLECPIKLKEYLEILESQNLLPSQHKNKKKV